MNTLKPCPFCGGTKICTEKGINLNYCDNCSAESNVEHWNTRPIEDALNARIAELETQVLKYQSLISTMSRMGAHDVSAYQAKIEELEKLIEGLRLDNDDFEEQADRLLIRKKELEAESERFTVHSDIERQDDKSPNDTQTQTIVYGKRWIPVSERLPEANGWYLCGMVSFLGATFTNEIYFDAVNINPRWNNPAQDRVYCWLDGVPELPEVTE